MTFKLSPYQDKFVEQLLNENKFCLFASPGVGKTFPAIVAAVSHQKAAREHFPILVTSPAYLIANWETEILRLYPDAVIVKANGQGNESRSLALESRKADFVLTSYANWSAKKKGFWVYRNLVGIKWATYIFDEAHRLRSHDSQTTKHVFQTLLKTNVNRLTPKLMLTGTPFCRDGGDYYVYFKLWKPQEYGSYWRFVDEFCVTTQTPWAKDVGNIKKSVADYFYNLTNQFAIKAKVKDIPELQDLEYIEQEHYVDMPPSVISTFKKAKKDYIVQHRDLSNPEYISGAGALYTRLRQLATLPPTKEKPKLDWLKDFLTDNPQKVACYVWYKSSAKAVAEAVLDRPVFVATGDLTPTARVAMVNKWKASDGGLLVATIPALCEGVSLVEAHDLVFLEHSPLASDQEQVIKRFCRRGQEEVVNVYHVRARQTVDMVTEKVLKTRGLGLEDALRTWLKE
jgi:SNF2 family DNA or RNA helicase